MRQPRNDREERDESPPPLEVMDVRLRLERGEPGKDKLASDREIIQEIESQYEAHGQHALPLVDELIGAYKAGGLPLGTSRLVDFYIATRIPAVLDALRENKEWEGCSIYDKCLLFEDGISQFEPELLDYLWKHRQSSPEPARSYVTNALGKAGGPKALEMLKLIASNLEDILSQPMAWLPEVESGGEISLEMGLNVLAAKANKEFLEQVRTASRRLKERGIGG